MHGFQENFKKYLRKKEKYIIYLLYQSYLRLVCPSIHLLSLEPSLKFRHKPSGKEKE